jgi:hypothetical protein
MIILSNATIAQNVVPGTVIGSLSEFSDGTAVSGATFILDDPTFEISGSNLEVAATLGGQGVASVCVYAVNNSYIIDEGIFDINIVAISPDGTEITAPNGSLVSASGVWTWGAETSTSGEYSIKLNGTAVSGSGHSVLLIANGGNIYTLVPGGSWYEWNALSRSWTDLNTTTTP